MHLEVDFSLVYSLYDSLEFMPRGIGQSISLCIDVVMFCGCKN
jgi:hypothetical protein